MVAGGKPFKLDDLDFRELPQVLKQCGRAVVREVCRCVMTRTQPNGSAQKQNAPSTIAAKGHDHPVFEKRMRFARESTFAIYPQSDTSVLITTKSPEDGEVGAHLEEQGYDFFGITEAADDEAVRIFETYLERVINEAWSKE